jgi:biopolymer transport protein ExbD
VKRHVRTGYFEADRPRVEVIPMIDIMMFLLVFFVVISLNMIAGSGVALEIPGSRTTQQIKKSTVTVGVTRAGEIVLEGRKVSSDELKNRLVQLKKDGVVDVVLAGDKEASLQVLLGVMDAIRGAGISSVGIAARAEKK